jgi:hypothetical protein
MVKYGFIKNRNCKFYRKTQLLFLKLGFFFKNRIFAVKTRFIFKKLDVYYKNSVSAAKTEFFL